MSIRPVKRIIQSQPTMEGAGRQAAPRLRLRHRPTEFDPFLLFDDFRNDRPDDYLAGFPWHPHRGIETITYVLAGTVEHGDSLGNKGTLGRRRRAVDDRGQRHPASGDAAGRRSRPHARLSALGQPALVAQDDGAALSGHPGGRDPGDRRRRRHARARGLRRFLGQARSGRRHRRRSALSRRLRSAGPAQDLAGRDRPPRLRLRVRGIGHVSATRRSRSAC